ncbi:NADPH:quinone reductase-like Zn-dependent oxidoreductase [Sphingomonas zeicaulis]|uniref:zinc-binding dehydrogenase n=1 Tax=Sphingomonas zeicaulis TaxID=1632740 RepID=UPI003D1EE62D
MQEFDAPVPGADEVLVAVKAISLNNGEVRGSLSAPAGYRPGWDLAGIVEAAPAGSSLSPGARVVGLKFEGAWAEQVVLPPTYLSRIPDEVDFEAASVLPVAGMTALLTLGKKQLEAGGKLLVTAATGGVGLLAVQLAAAAGAHVTAYLRTEEDAGLLRRLGAHAVALGTEDAARRGPYDLILEGVGGKLLGSALSWLAPRGVCVQFGDAAGDELTTFDAKVFRLGPGGTYGGTSLYGFFLGEELNRPEPAIATPLLADLASRLAAGTLDPVISQRGSWRDIDEISRALLARRFKGKAVLRID